MCRKILSKFDRILRGPTRLVCGLVLVLYLSFVSFITVAAPFEPKQHDVVANWDSSKLSTSKTLQTVRDHLQLAQFPGQANIHHSMARAILVDLASQEQRNPEYWYLHARSLQHQHDFDQAVTALNTALKLDANFPSAWLLKANIQMAQSDFTAAKKSCTQLLGKTDLMTVATCSLEVASYQGELAQSYKQLSTLMLRSQTTDYAIDKQFWGVQVIADMALRLDMAQAADQWMEKALKIRKLAKMPLSFVALWADIQRELGMQQKIQTELSAILEEASFKDDALLVRVAMAEKASNEANSVNPWQQAVARRVQLRLQRNDLYHAADIARFYIYVQTSPKEALKWAKINYQQAQLFDDEKLLIEAKRLNGINHQKGQKYEAG